jgi:hypothetical protein
MCIDLCIAEGGSAMLRAVPGRTRRRPPPPLRGLFLSALLVAVATAAAAGAEEEPPDLGAESVSEAIEPAPAGDEAATRPEHTVWLYQETAPSRRAYEDPPPPRRADDPWRYGTQFFLYTTRGLPESRLPGWARIALAPFAFALDAIDLPLAAVAGLYGD